MHPAYLQTPTYTSSNEGQYYSGQAMNAWSWGHSPHASNYSPMQHYAPPQQYAPPSYYVQQAQPPQELYPSRHSTRACSLAAAHRLRPAVVAREVERALGVPSVGPTFLATDNKANLLVARDAGSAARSKHFLRTYYSLKERQNRGDVELGHVGDEQNPADFLTKWVGRKKLEQSIDYATNRRAAFEPAT